MANRFDSARYMLARAKQLTFEFESNVAAFLASKPYACVIDIDPNTKDQIGKVKLVKPMPIMLNGIASDAVNNLRSSLDQAGYQVSIAAGGKGKSTHFPFGDTAAEVKDRKKSGSKEIPDEIFSLMESFKPYKRGDSLLWALNKLCNSNKHRIVIPVAVIVSQQSMDMTFNVVKSGPIKFSPPTWDSTKNEMEILRTKGAKIDRNWNVKFAPFISFSHVDFVINHPADTILNALLGKVNCILMAIEAEAIRIGLFK